MKATMASSALRDSLAKVIPIVEKSDARPILGYVLVEFGGSAVSLQATNLEESARVVLDAEVEGAPVPAARGGGDGGGDPDDGGPRPFSLCVNAKNLFEILRELPDERAVMEFGGGEGGAGPGGGGAGAGPGRNLLRVHGGGARYSMLVHGSANFPRLSFRHSGKDFLLPAERLQRIVAKISHAISYDETRVSLNGVFIREFEGRLRSVSTDGNRFAMLDTEVEGLAKDALWDGVIVPRKGVGELKRMAEAAQGKDVRMSVDETFLYASVGDRHCLSVRLIARDYPRYQNAIPEKTAFTLVADRGALLEVMRRVRIMSSRKSGGVRVSLGPNRMEISAKDVSLGDANETVAVEYEGDGMEIGFNARYLIDALSVLDDGGGPGKVELKFNNGQSPVVMRPVGRSDYLGIVMPMEL